MALGKTNITTLSEGAIVTEIEDYKWVQMQAGITGNFVKAIYKNDYLVAITADGTVAYTTDGEVWNTSVLEYTGCKLNDIDWDGNKFILVGSYLNEQKDTKGLIVMTEDLITYSKIDYGFKVLAIYPINGAYILITDIGSSRSALEAKWITIAETIKLIKESSLHATTYPVEAYSISKNTDGILIYYTANSSPTRYQYIKKIDYDGVNAVGDSWERSDNKKTVTVFECKDILYAIELLEETGYNLYKITDSNEKILVCSNQNFMFKDGTYFNECEIFINSHEMLVVKKGESITNKTIDNLVEIAPELTMNCITKAFGQLYIFGNQGAILKSSVETNNEETIIVQVLSAKRALAESKIYTDEQVASLEARIVILEEKISALETIPETE